MDCRLGEGASSFLCKLMAQAGCSNMLSERRNCFLGRALGAHGLRTWATAGEPLRTLASMP